MLETLDSDCWLELNKYLVLEDQIALYEAFKGISNKLIYDVAFAWEHQHSFLLDRDIYEKFEEMPELLNIFLSSIKATQEMEFRWVKVEFLRLWENYTFPSMKTLEYTLDEDLLNIDMKIIEAESEEAITIMAKIFPGLESLKPHSGFECSSLVKLTQLRKLDLSEWMPFCGAWGCIHELTKLSLLEELIVTKYLRFTDLYENLMAMPKMHTFCFYLYNRDDILDSLLENRGLDVHKTIFNCCISVFSMPTLHKFKNLRHLTLYYENSFPCEKLIEMIANLKQLEQLDLIECKMMLNEAALWQTVDCCPSLRILNISNVYLKEDFFDGNRCVMEKTLSNRSQDLTLYYLTPREIRKLMRQLFKHPQLKLSFEPLDPHYIESNTIQMHFKPLLPS